MPRPCPPPFASCGPGCPPCAPSPCPGCCPGGAAGACAISAVPLAVQGVENSTIPGHQSNLTIVPGMQTAPFNSPTAEFLLIDANAVVGFTGADTIFSVLFGVFVDNAQVPGSIFGTKVDNPGTGATIDFTQSTTLLVPVPPGPHVVDLRWNSVFSQGGGSIDILRQANLRVVRLACAI